MKFDLTDICGTKHEMDTENWGERFINIDCMDALKAMPDKCVDLCIVDPPYGINIGTSVGGAGRLVKVGGEKLSRPKIYRGFDDTQIPDDKYFKELFRVSVNQIIWGGNYFINHLQNTPCMIVWDKDNSGNFADCELAWASFKTSVRMFTYRWNGMLQQNMKNKEERQHPTQKPIALYKWLLSNYAKPGDKILDTHVGSASSLIACHQMGFEYWGFELDTDYYKAATERLNKAKAQVDIFEAAGLPKPEQIGVEEGK